MKKILIDITNVHIDDRRNLVNKIAELELLYTKEEKVVKSMTRVYYVVALNLCGTGLQLCDYLSDECWSWEFVKDVKTHDTWLWVSENLPDYYGSSEVLLSDILQRYLDNEELDDSDVQMVLDGKPDHVPDKVWATYRQHETDAALFKEAIDASK